MTHEEELDAELVRVMNAARSKEWEAAMQKKSRPLPLLLNARLDRAGRLAVARYSAEKQRGMEPTMGMYDEFNRAVQSNGSELPFGGFPKAYRAMQSAAPLWVEKK